MRARVLHGHELVEVIAIERPSVYYLLSMGVDHEDVPSARHVYRFAPPRRYLNRRCVHSVSSPGSKTLIRPADGIRRGALPRGATRATILSANANGPSGKVARCRPFGGRTQI